MIEAAGIGIITRSGVEREPGMVALETLGKPEAESRSTEYEGRRLVRVDGGYVALNYMHYREKDNPRSRFETRGYVYYIGVPIGGLVKIGFSQNPWARIGALRTTNPNLQILAVERGTMEQERNRHEEFKAERTEGEWFTRSDSLQSLIRELSNGTINPLPTRSYRIPVVATNGSDVALEVDAEAEVDKIKNRFVRPALPEVTSYCQERQNLVDPQQWLNYYTANGFKVGRSSMRDWRAAVRTWEKNTFTKGTTPVPPKGYTSESKRLKAELEHRKAQGW